MTFGEGGKVTTGFFDELGDAAAAIVLQSDYKIVVAGYAHNPATGYDFAVVRYNTGGTLDATFGSGGKVTTDFFGGRDQVLDIAIQSDGKIVTTGIVNHISDDFGLTRYNIDGTLDSSFGFGGRVTTDIAGYFDVANAIAIQSDGKIVIAGVAAAVPNGGGVITRYEPNGALDTTFGINGKLYSPVDANDVAIQANGKIVIAGGAVANGITDFGIMRYNNDGSPDSGFGAAGKIATDVFGNDDGAFAVAIQPDGKIVAAGFALDITSSNESFALARYNGDGVSVAYKSTDGGTTWTPIGNGLICSDVWRMAVDPSSPSTVYVVRIAASTNRQMAVTFGLNRKA